jgi:hypothetical protein
LVVRSRRILSRSAAPISLTERKAAVAKAGPAKEAPVEKTKADEVFKRFTAYADVRFANGRELKNVVVFNAEDLDVPDEFAQTEIKDLNLRPT